MARRSQFTQGSTWRRTRRPEDERGPNSRAAQRAHESRTEILNGQRAITGDTALRLAHFFGTSAEFWLNLQSLYELARGQAKTGKAIKKLPTLKHLEEAHA